MTLSIDRRLMDAAYGPRLKVIVASADAQQLARAFTHDLLDAAGIELIQYEATLNENGTARLSRPGESAGESVELTSPPSGHCLLASISAQGRSELASLQTWWNENGPNGTPDLVAFDPASSAQTEWPLRLMRHLVEVVQADARRCAEREVSLNGQLYELRQEYDQARGATQAMQDHLARVSLAPCNLAYAYSPAAEVHQFKSNGETLVQRLPVRAEGLAGFDFFISPGRNAAGANEHFLVTLKARECDAPLGTWMIHGHQLAGSWARCAFPIALTSPFHQIELHVKWVGASRNCPGVALSAIHPWDELRATVDGSPLGGALAHVVWCAVPGVKTGVSSAPFRKQSDDETLFTHTLGRDTLSRAIPTTSTTAHYLDLLLHQGGFRLHPLDGIVAAAVIPDACLPGAQAVTAVAQINHPAAKYKVEYAMALTHSASNCRAFPQDARASEVMAMSGWQSVPPDGAPHVVSLTLPKENAHPLDLHVATRMAEGNSTAHQWADWLEIRVTLRCPSPIMPMSS